MRHAKVWGLVMTVVVGAAVLSGPVGVGIAAIDVPAQLPQATPAVLAVAHAQPILDVTQVQALVDQRYPDAGFLIQPEPVIQDGVLVYVGEGAIATIAIDALSGKLVEDYAERQTSQNPLPACDDSDNGCPHIMPADWHTDACKNPKFLCAIDLALVCPPGECLGVDPIDESCNRVACHALPDASVLESGPCTSDGVSTVCVEPIDCSVVVCEAQPATPAEASAPIICGMLRADGSVGCPDPEPANPSVPTCIDTVCSELPAPMGVDAGCATAPGGMSSCVVVVDCTEVGCEAHPATPVEE